MELKEKLKYILKDTNSWWKRGDFSVEYRERDIMRDIEKYLKLPQVIALVGLRRTGKTTLLFRLIELYLRRIPAGSICYFSFDDFAKLDIEDLIEAYKEIFPDTNLDEGKYLFCFDEIQKLAQWQDKIKRLYDTHKNIKIIISGSESLFIRKGIKENLGGRIFEFVVSPLTFREYLSFIDKNEWARKPALFSKEIVKAFRDFMISNGFPEIAHERDSRVIHKYLKETVVDKILFQDIPQLFEVRNVGIVGELLDIISYSPGQIIDVSKLAKELGLSRQAVASYLDYLEKSFLIKKVYNFSRNLRKQKRSLKKYYPAVVFPQVVEDKFALCFENSLIWQSGVSFFWRDAYKNEVDAILVKAGRRIIPVEIKTGEVELTGIARFIRKFKISGGLVITLDKSAVKGNIRLVPFYSYLLLEEPP